MAGQQVVYLRNPDYMPRDEMPSGSTGGRKVHLDKVIWRYALDPRETAEDLAAGEIDWRDQPPPEFIPKIKQNPDLQTFAIDPLGTQGWLRPNCLHPPFNNNKAREALLHMMDQVTYLAWAVGQAEYYRPCYSVFACGGPYTTTVGAEPMMEHKLGGAARAGVGLRRPAHCVTPCNGHPLPQRRRGSHPATTRVDRLQGRLEGHGLIDNASRARKQGAARQGRVEPISHLVAGGRRHLRVT